MYSSNLANAVNVCLQTNQHELLVHKVLTALVAFWYGKHGLAVIHKLCANWADTLINLAILNICR